VSVLYLLYIVTVMDIHTRYMEEKTSSLQML